MEQPQAKDLSITNFSTIFIQKDRLLEAIKANRDKHNSIYEAAVSGYWLEANKVLSQKEAHFTEVITQVKDQFEKQKVIFGPYVENQDKTKAVPQISLSFGFNGYWPLSFPECHLEDYDRVINMLEFSVADKVELSANDFNAYVRNNWSWRASFLNNNVGYATTAYAPLAVSGCFSPMFTANVGNVCVTGASMVSLGRSINTAF